MRIRSNIPRVMILGILFMAVFCGVGAAIELTVILPGDQKISVSATPDQTVEQVKQTIFTITSISPLNESIIYKGKRLNEGRTLSSVRVREGDTLQVVHDTHSAPTTKQKSDIWWVLLVILVIIGISVLFMRKKTSWEYDGK